MRPKHRPRSCRRTLAICMGAAALAATLVTSAASAHAASDPCSLLTREEIATVTGTPVREAQAASIPRPTCIYTLAKGKTYVYWFSDDSARQDFLAGRKYQDMHTQPVAGVGDDAYWSPGVQTLNVLRRGTYLMIQFSAQTRLGLEPAKVLATKALRRM